MGSSRLATPVLWFCMPPQPLITCTGYFGFTYLNKIKNKHTYIYIIKRDRDREEKKSKEWRIFPESLSLIDLTRTNGVESLVEVLVSLKAEIDVVLEEERLDGVAAVGSIAEAGKRFVACGEVVGVSTIQPKALIVAIKGTYKGLVNFYLIYH